MVGVQGELFTSPESGQQNTNHLPAFLGGLNGLGL